MKFYRFNNLNGCSLFHLEPNGSNEISESWIRIYDLYDKINTKIKNYDFEVPPLDFFKTKEKPKKIFSNLHVPGIAVNKVVLDFLTTLNLPKFTHHKVRYVYKNMWQDDCYQIVFREDLDRYIDFRDSIWVVKREGAKVEVRFNTFEEYLNELKHHGLDVQAHSIKLNKEAYQFDILVFSFSPSNYYCNENFMNRVRDEKIKELEFYENKLGYFPGYIYI